MPRMFIEGIVGSSDSPREACRKLMVELDDEAAKAGHRVTGDVTIFEVRHALTPALMLRLEADVVPAV